MNPLRIFLLAALILVVFGADNVEADEPEWNYVVEPASDTYFWQSSFKPSAISADGQYIVSSTASTVYFFDKITNVPLWTYDLNGSMITSLAISSDGSYIAVGTAASDSNLYLFDKDSSNPIWNYTTGRTIMSVSISANGEYIIANSYTGLLGYEMYLFNNKNNTPLWNVTSYFKIYSNTPSNSGQFSLVMNLPQTNSISFFSNNIDIPLWTYNYSNSLGLVDISNTGEYVVISTENRTNSEFSIFLFHKESNIPLWKSEMKHISNYVTSLEISSNGEYILLNTYEGFYLFHKGSNVPLWKYVGDATNLIQRTYSTDAFSADGNHFVTIIDSDSLFLFETENPDAIWSYDFGDSVSSVAISTDGHYLVSGTNMTLSFFKIYDHSIDESSLPSISLLTSLISIGLIAIFRRK